APTFQNVSRRLNCSWRFSFTCTDWLPRAVVTWPKAASLKLVSGLSKCGVLVRLNDSARNSALIRSVTRSLPQTEKSISHNLGPCKMLRPASPNALGVGAEHAAVLKYS